MAHSSALAAHVQRRVDKLERTFRGVVSCHVVVELVSRHHRHGNRYRVSVHLGLPGHELLVSHAPSDAHHVESAGGTADRAFEEVGRQLEDWTRRERGHRHDAARGS